MIKNDHNSWSRTGFGFCVKVKCKAYYYYKGKFQLQYTTTNYYINYVSSNINPKNQHSQRM